MSKNEYVFKLEELKSELEKLQDKFTKIEPSTDWNKIRIEPLLRHLDTLKNVIGNNQSAVRDELIKSDLEYFDRNIEGLKTVLRSEIRLKEGKNGIHG